MVSVAKIVSDVESIMVDINSECTHRLRRSSRNYLVVPYGVAYIASMLLRMASHFNEKGVNVSKRSPYNLNRIIVQIKKMRRTTITTGQGRLEQVYDKTIMLPHPLVRTLKLFHRMIDLCRERGWNTGRQVPAPMDQLLDELIAFRRRHQSKRVQG